MIRKTNSTLPSETEIAVSKEVNQSPRAAVPADQQLGWEVFESLSEADIVEYLMSSPPFLELCRVLRRPDDPRGRSLRGALKHRSEWLRNDPTYAAEVFLNSWPNRRPPRWNMDWVASALRGRLDGKGTMDSLMGFGGRGKRPFTVAKRRQRLLIQFADIAHLIALDLKTREAAHLVCCRDNPTLRASDDCESADRLVSMTNTLAGEYGHYAGRKGLEKFFKLGQSKPDAIRAVTAEFVTGFPRSEIMRTKLRRFLR